MALWVAASVGEARAAQSELALAVLRKLNHVAQRRPLQLCPRWWPPLRQVQIPVGDLSPMPTALRPAHSPHPIAASSHGTPYGPERAAAALADPSEPYLDMSPLNRVLSADTHLVRLLSSSLLSVVVVLKPRCALA